MSSPRYYVLLNPNSGTAQQLGLSAPDLERLFAEQGLEAIVDGDDNQPMEARLQRAIDSGAEVIVAAGGDGTVTAAATAMAGSDRQLAILPAGTMNLLAKDLALPLDIPTAIAGLSALEPQRIDLAEVNGRIFMHKVVLGYIPSLAAGREHIRKKTGIAAKLGFLGYVVRRVARAHRIAVRLEPKGEAPRIERAHAVAIANNAYDEGMGRFFAREQLDGGFLTIYVARRLRLGDMLRLAAEMWLGRWRADDALAIERTTSVTLSTRRRLVKVMLDGEVMTLTAPLKFQIHGKALTVLVPKKAPAAETSEERDVPGLIGLAPGV